MQALQNTTFRKHLNNALKVFAKTIKKSSIRLSTSINSLTTESLCF